MKFNEDCNATELEADLTYLAILCWKVLLGPRSSLGANLIGEFLQNNGAEGANKYQLWSE